MFKNINKLTVGDGGSSSKIHFDLSDQSCVNTHLGQLFIDKAGLSRSRMEYNEAFLEIYDGFIHAEMLEYFGFDCDEVRSLAFERHFATFVEDAPSPVLQKETFPNIKDCKRGLELHEMCDGFKREFTRSLGCERSAYFDRMDTLCSEDDIVQAALKKRTSELHRQRIKGKKAKKQAGEGEFA